MPDLTRVDAYDYHLPEERIAQFPSAEREAARLLIVRRQTGMWEHRSIRDLPALLNPGDLLILNDSRVVPARLQGVRSQTGGRWDGLFLGQLPEGRWKIVGQTRGRLQAGESLTIPAPTHPDQELRLRLEERLEGGMWRALPESNEAVWSLLDRFGTVPLPPYIRDGQECPGDRERYQTVYAAHPGSAAAPTAGLHFSETLLNECQSRGIGQAKVTLHVGLGTFRPVSVDDIREHPMHAEWCQCPPDTARQIHETRQQGHRVIAVGTTSLRTVETAFAAEPSGVWEGESRLMIYPPYQFRAVDGLLTNFHLPKSTLLMLVSALGGYELIRSAYAAAIAEGYRFFSYGDAMLIL